MHEVAEKVTQSVIYRAKEMEWRKKKLRGPRNRMRSFKIIWVPEPTICENEGQVYLKSEYLRVFLHEWKEQIRGEPQAE